MLPNVTGKNTKKKLNVIAENLEKLEWLGLVMCDQRDNLTYWHYAETIKSA